MKLKFEKNIQFTRTIKADNRLREFNFRKLGGLQEGVFTIDVVDDRGNRMTPAMSASAVDPALAPGTRISRPET